MKTYVIGDIHGVGEELLGLMDRISPVSGDTVIFVGDLFDRGLHAHLVWDLIQSSGIKCLMGNHEYKMCSFLEGKRDNLPSHYYVAMNLLSDAGVAPNELLGFIQGLPMLMSFDDFIVVHAGVLPGSPRTENISANIYGNLPSDLPMPSGSDSDGRVYWWDEYKGSDLVIYGHLVTGNNLPRLRFVDGRVNSVGLDTSAVHGGVLTGICVEDFRFYSYSSGIDWSKECKTRNSGVLLNSDYLAFARGNRGGV